MKSENQNLEVNAELSLEVNAEYCCDNCCDISDNLIDCPVCNTENAKTDVNWELLKEKKLSCEVCGATFEKISGLWYLDCVVKIVSIGFTPLKKIN